MFAGDTQHSNFLVWLNFEEGPAACLIIAHFKQQEPLERSLPEHVTLSASASGQ